MTTTLYHGNCLEYTRGMPDKSVDVTIADPPYSEHVHGKGRRAGAMVTGLGNPCVRVADLGFDHIQQADLERAANEMLRVSRRWVAVFCDHELSHSWLTAFGEAYVRTAIWIKEACSPQFTGDRPAAAHECIVLAHPKGKKRWNGGGSRGVWSHAIVNPNYADRVHTTQKPLPLMLDLVSLFSDADETVFDPFMGSGTTGVACARLGRSFIGCEMQEKYITIARSRIEAEQANSTRLAIVAGQTSLFGTKKP